MSRGDRSFTQLKAAGRGPAGKVFAEMNKQVEFMVVTDIFIVRDDPTLIRLSSYNDIVIASVSSGCQSPTEIYVGAAVSSPNALTSTLAVE